MADKKKISNTKKIYESYKDVRSQAKKMNEELRDMVFKAEQKKKYVDGFDKSVDLSLKLFLGIAALSYIRRETREDAERKVAALYEEAKKLDKSPDGIGALQEFMDRIDKGFNQLMKEKSDYDAEERRKQEEIRRKEEEERRKKEAARRKEEEERRKKREEEEEEERRRRRNSYSSSSSDYSWSSSSSSSSSSDSYSGGSFGGGGSSGDW